MLKKILSLSFMVMMCFSVFQTAANASVNQDEDPSQSHISVQTVVTQAIPQHLYLAYKIRQGAGIVAIFDALVNCRKYKDSFYTFSHALMIVCYSLLKFQSPQTHKTPIDVLEASSRSIKAMLKLIGFMGFSYGYFIDGINMFSMMKWGQGGAWEFFSRAVEGCGFIASGVLFSTSALIALFENDLELQAIEEYEDLNKNNRSLR